MYRNSFLHRAGRKTEGVNGKAGGRKMDNEKAWNFAIGIVQIDGIKPSDDLMGLIEREKRGEITNEDIRRILREKYTKE